MLRFNHLLMALLFGLFFWLINQYVPMAPLINLLFNFFMLVIIVIYIMQFLGAIKAVLPAPDIFK
jgi:predicted ABC-type exoprotein transport system permease subunit